MLFYRVALPLSRRTRNLAARTIRTHRRKIGSRWRRLDPAQQALLVLVHLYKGETFSQVGAVPNGEPLWIPWSLLGSVHDTQAARVWKVAERVKATALLGLGGKGYVGLSAVVFCPFKGRDK